MTAREHECADAGRVSAPALAILLQRAGAGDQSAFADVFDTTAPRVYGLALRILGDRDKAETVAGASYVEIWRRAPEFDAAQGSATSWIIRLAHARSVECARHDRARTGPVRRLRHGWGLPGWPPGRRVGSALADLTPGQRESLSLTYFGGFTHTEVADLTRVSREVAGERIRAGLTRLGALVEAS